MHEKHPCFTPPEDPQAVIWRYVDLARFLSLLASRSLYFTRADLLGDPFEGTITKATVAAYANPTSPTSLPAFQESLRKLRESLRRNVAVSCWHVAERESTAMWSQYAARGSGIALRSTYARLVHSLRNWATPTYVGLVHYIDYDAETSEIGGNNLLLPFVHKRAEFSSEREIRAVISQIPASDRGIDHSVAMVPGTLAPIDVAELVERVVVSPRMPDWELEALRAVIAKMDCKLSLERSRLNVTPVLG